MDKIDLAITGGGTRGSYYLGFLKALFDHNIEVRRIAGTSAGATTALVYSTMKMKGKTFEEIVDVLSKITFWKVMIKNPLHLRRRAIWDPDKFKNFLKEIIDPDLTLGELNNNSIPVGICFNRNGKLFVLDDPDTNVLDVAVYSMSFPWLLPPYVYQGDHLYDADTLGSDKYFGAAWLRETAYNNGEEKLPIIALITSPDYGLLLNTVYRMYSADVACFPEEPLVMQVIIGGLSYSPITFWHMRQGYELGIKIGEEYVLKL